jgi:hypothetical protein
MRRHVRMLRTRAESTLANLSKQGDTANGHPFCHENVPIAEEHGIVGMDELARDEVFARVATQVSWLAIAELDYRFVVPIQNGDHTFQVRNQHQVLTQAEVTG